ncbi:hypothetical protein PV325_006466 [Microctonus aethiopoides]|uniref:Thioredoxin domain-containing protein n=1 Tax=Microctonus aethiopoides TaxID=144406 RepID=A0AA39KLU9_9HYME|nr:hypothetical protein PV325_006466 [Microctonus aethiopoides]KAK0166298.1 hypothetical protein PV328_004731 [Microctonus aethiopoides]
MTTPKLFVNLFIIILLVCILPIPGLINEELSEAIVIDENDSISSLTINDNNETKSDETASEKNLLDTENIVLEENDDENKTLVETKTNATVAEPNRTDAAYRIYSNCLTDKIYGTVEIVNATRLMELLITEPTPANRSEIRKDGKINPRTCVLVLFYSRWCVFSSQAAPHFNALPKFFPHIKAVAIDASKYQNFNMQFGIVGVPTLMFVYNGKPLIKFNDTSYTLESFARFVTDYTALEPNSSLYVTSADFSGPIPSTPSNETDYCLVLSWIFIAACAIYFTLQSQWWKQFVELVQNTWRESNAQHEHTE